MGDHRRIITFIAVLLLVLMLLTGYERLNSDSAHDSVEAFQEFACGFGIGASIDPKWGFINFDPRIDAVDETVLFPVPGGYSYSPDIGMTVTVVSEISVE